MKFFKSLIAAVFAATSLCASAQDKYEFVPNWYLQVNGGVQHTLGEAKFGDLLSPNAQLGVGYNFSKVFGARLSVDAWQSKGALAGYRAKGQSTATTQVYKYKYVAPQLDLTCNLSNAFCGWNPKRVFNVILFAGGALNIGFDNKEVKDLAAKAQDNPSTYQLEYIWDGTQLLGVGRAGLDFDFRLSDAIKLNIEGSANVTSDKYNSKKAGNADWYFNALIGLKIALGKSYNKVEEPVVVPPAPQPKPQPKPEPKPVVKAPVEKTINVFFLIRSSEISEKENVKVQEMISFLKANPTAKVTVTGYADAGTGNPKINMGYSEGRAKAVTNALINGGIDASRITTEAKGDTVQPFAENDLNRVTIAVAKE